MNCQRVQEGFIDYQTGSLPAAEATELRAHLASCPVCQKEWAALQEISRKLDQLPSETPSPRLSEQFYAMLETHRREADSLSPFAFARSRLDRFFETLLPSRPATQFAFAFILLVAGLLAGARFLRPPVNPPINSLDQAELAALRAKVDSMGRLVTYSLLQQRSTSERIQDVLATMNLARPDRKVLTDLVGALAFDPSVNVRLSAVEALSAHANDQLVRAGVLSALPRETAPLVQVAMIELLATVRDPSCAPVLIRLSREETADRDVRDAARRALAVLRTPSPSGISPNAQLNQPKPTLT
ncbi:MAG: zf-HC2 domain-containing protein [Opitutaceae bacterium]|nr:zf-HC2 domain-containing protein [Opitutaceae bacterium]